MMRSLAFAFLLVCSFSFAHAELTTSKCSATEKNHPACAATTNTEGVVLLQSNVKMAKATVQAQDGDEGEKKGVSEETKQCVKDEGGGDMATAITAIRACYPVAAKAATKIYEEAEKKRKAADMAREKAKLKEMGWFDDPPKKKYHTSGSAALAELEDDAELHDDAELMEEDRYYPSGAHEEMVKQMGICVADKGVNYEAYQKARGTCVQKAREKFEADLNACTAEAGLDGAKVKEVSSECYASVRKAAWAARRAKSDGAALAEIHAEALDAEVVEAQLEDLVSDSASELDEDKLIANFAAKEVESRFDFKGAMKTCYADKGIDYEKASTVRRACYKKVRSR